MFLVSPSNVDSIDLDRHFTTSGQVESSPSIVNGIAYFNPTTAMYTP